MQVTQGRGMGRGAKTDGLIKISDMAAMVRVSRQTLILYDKNGLLHPAYVNEAGYRYYSVDQLPYLRFICLLKSTGVPLAQIRELMWGRRDPRAVAAVLGERASDIRREVARLSLQAEEIDQLSELFLHAEARELGDDLPQVQWIDARRAIYVPFPTQEMDPGKLHLTLMQAWGQLLDAGMIPSRGFGSVVRVAALGSETPLAGAGSIVVLPHDREVPGATVIDIPAGVYATMYHYAMPYDLAGERRLLAWMAERGLEPEGDAIDRCLFDTVFHTEEHAADFSRVEIKVRTA
ncbi:MAG: MerR family transcriptional regulator [Olegusella sp.]|nr:MerR family transcriptional regulator [Olegusella sp.]